MPSTPHSLSATQVSHTCRLPTSVSVHWCVSGLQLLAPGQVWLSVSGVQSTHRPSSHALAFSGSPSTPLHWLPWLHSTHSSSSWSQRAADALVHCASVRQATHLEVCVLQTGMRSSQ
jgi:hypothetical protein